VVSAGMSGEGHDAYNDETAVGDPVDEDPIQVQYHHDTVTGHPQAVTGHPDSSGYKEEGASIDQVQHHHHQVV
jgi:hypothetical protein